MLVAQAHAARAPHEGADAVGIAEGDEALAGDERHHRIAAARARVDVMHRVADFIEEVRG